MTEPDRPKPPFVVVVSTGTTTPTNLSIYPGVVIGTKGSLPSSIASTSELFLDSKKWANSSGQLTVGTATSLGSVTAMDRARVVHIGFGAIVETPDSMATVARRAYPHLVEAGQPALALILRSLNDARLALASYDGGDISGAVSRLSVIAVQCAEAHPLTTFNESFGAVVSYIRRATLIANAEEISRPALNSLVLALKQLTVDPMITLRAAGEIIGILSSEGWQGEYRAVDRLLALLSEELESDESVGAEA